MRLLPVEEAYRAVLVVDHFQHCYDVRLELFYQIFWFSVSWSIKHKVKVRVVRPRFEFVFFAGGRFT